MGNLGETKPISKLIIEIDGDEYEFSGGGGIPAPNSVGTEQIIDGAVEEEDLHDDVKGRMTVTHDASTGGIRLGGYAQAGNIPANNNSQDVGQGGGEDSDDETGFENGAVDGESDI